MANSKEKKKFLWILTIRVSKSTGQVLNEAMRIPCVKKVVVGDFEAYGNVDRFIEVRGSQTKIRAYLEPVC